MKAIRINEFGGPEVMRIEVMPDLQAGPGQVVVRLKAIGVNPVDTYIRAGSYPGFQAPLTPGLDGAGIVEAIGDGVTRVRPGDRVYTGGTLSGTYAEQTLCTESQVHPLPELVSFAEGACMGVPYATAYRALFQLALARGGETVLVHGATGGVGNAAVQLARAAGMKVLGTGGTDRGRKLAMESGAHRMFNHQAPGYLEEIMSLTGGNGVDVILEMLSNVNLGKDLKIMARNGRVVVIGCRGTVELDPRDAMINDITILGMSLFNTPERELTAIHAGLVAGLEKGILRPFIGREMPLGDAPQSHIAIMESGAYGKIILIP